MLAVHKKEVAMQENKQDVGLETLKIIITVLFIIVLPVILYCGIFLFDCSQTSEEEYYGTHVGLRGTILIGTQECMQVEVFDCWYVLVMDDNKELHLVGIGKVVSHSHILQGEDGCLLEETGDGFKEATLKFPEGQYKELKRIGDGPYLWEMEHVIDGRTHLYRFYVRDVNVWHDVYREVVRFEKVD